MLVALWLAGRSQLARAPASPFNRPLLLGDPRQRCYEFGPLPAKSSECYARMNVRTKSVRNDFFLLFIRSRRCRIAYVLVFYLNHYLMCTKGVIRRPTLEKFLCSCLSRRCAHRERIYEWFFWNVTMQHGCGTIACMRAHVRVSRDGEFFSASGVARAA